MFNNELKENAIRNLESSINQYDILVNKIRAQSLKLFNVRQRGSEQVIGPVEEYINMLANTPKEFDKSFKEFKAEYKIFNDQVEKLNKEIYDANLKAAGTSAAGVIAGIGTVAFMPATAIAIATTFGTASTGTAIASLSGAAAMNAALAWLGGGAIAVGGGGMASGTAFLALAGPIGIGIGAVGFIGAGLLYSSKNKEIAHEANEKRKEVEIQIKSLKKSKLQISKFITLTKKHQKGVLEILSDLKENAPNNYEKFNDDFKYKIGALINHINALSLLINKNVE